MGSLKRKIELVDDTHREDIKARFYSLMTPELWDMWEEMREWCKDYRKNRDLIILRIYAIRKALQFFKIVVYPMEGTRNIGWGFALKTNKTNFYREGFKSAKDATIGFIEFLD